MKVINHLRLFSFLLIVVMLVLLAAPVWASDRDDVTATADATATAAATASAHVTGGDLVGGDMIGGDTNVSTGGNRTFAFAHGLGDVDINQCIVTKQTGTFIVSWQGYDYNLWCMGEVFDAKGLYKMGAEMRCDIEPIASKFEFREDCLDANTVMQEIIESPQLSQLYEQHARLEEDEAEHQERIEQVQMEQAIMMERLDQWEQRLEERPPERVYVQQEPRISEEQIEEAWQLIKGAKGKPE